MHSLTFLARGLGALLVVILHACAPGDAVHRTSGSPGDQAATAPLPDPVPGPLPDPPAVEPAADPAGPTARTANPLVGTDLGPDLERLGWLQTTPRSGPAELTLYRWWTTGCPFCRSSLPDLDRLASRFPDRLRVVGIYHEKGARQWTADELIEYAAATGFERGDLAIDRDWRVLRDVLRRARLDRATSISVLVDAENEVVWVHEGPRLHRSGQHAAADAAMRELEQLVGTLTGQ